LESNEVEIRVRKTGEAINCPIGEVSGKVQELLSQL